MNVVLTTLSGYVYLGTVNLQPGEDHTGDPVEAPYVTVTGIKRKADTDPKELSEAYSDVASHKDWLVPWHNIDDMMDVPEEE